MGKAKRKMSDDPVLHRILEMLRQRNRTDIELVNYLGLSNGAVTKWKYQGSKSYLTHISEIADFVEVTPDYLLNGVDREVNIENLSPLEVTLLQMFRKIDVKGQECIVETVTRFADAMGAISPSS